MRIKGSVFSLFLAELWRRGFRAVAGGAFSAWKAAEEGLQSNSWAEVGRKLHALPHDILQGRREVGRAACEQVSASQRGSCRGREWDPHESSAAGACAGGFKGLVLSSVLCCSPGLSVSSLYSSTQVLAPSCC